MHRARTRSPASTRCLRWATRARLRGVVRDAIDQLTGDAARSERGRDRDEHEQGGTLQAPHEASAFPKCDTTRLIRTVGQLVATRDGPRGFFLHGAPMCDVCAWDPEIRRSGPRFAMALRVRYNFPVFRAIERGHGADRPQSFRVSPCLCPTPAIVRTERAKRTRQSRKPYGNSGVARVGTVSWNLVRSSTIVPSFCSVRISA
jgi:hypothetical protein